VAANEIPYSPQLESGNCLHNSGSVNKETALVKAFSTGRERIHFLTSILHEVLKGNRSLKEYVHFAFLLYKNEMKQIVEKEGISMTIGEKNIREWVDELGLKDTYIKEGIRKGISKGIRRGDKMRQLKVAKNMLKKGFSIEVIMDTTELSREEILKLRDEG
jgi:predicted transposase/invertase (TIGR01784 family)